MFIPDSSTQFTLRRALAVLIIYGAFLSLALLLNS